MAFKLIHHEHSGRLKPHEHTSYSLLAVLMLFVGLVLGICSISTVSADHPEPQAGSIGLTGAMPAAPPKTAAVITSPKSGTHFGQSPVTISGTCPAGTLVEVYKNNIFAGSTPCDDSGKFSIDIDPLFGENVITAQVYDVLNQAGPTSTPITIFYDARPQAADPLSFLNFSGDQMLLTTDAVYRGSFPGQMINVPVNIIGGTAPYAINIQWGDPSNKVVPRGDNSTFNVGHAYDKPGTYKITLQGSDSQQRVAFLTVAAVINGQPSVIASSNLSKKAINKLLVLWPVYTIAIAIIISFWLGERREKKIIEELNNSQNSPFKLTPKPPTEKPQNQA
jgi:hypothetical protein